MGIKVAICVDHTLFRQGLAALVNDFDGIKVILQAKNGFDLLEKVPTNKPDVVLLDLEMPEMDGIETTKRLKATHQEIKIIIVSVFNQEKYILHLLDCDVNGYLFKNAEPEEVEAAIREVSKNDFYVNTAVAKALKKVVSWKRPRKPKLEFGPDFTKKEINVIRLTCEGLTSKEIGKELYINYRTVEGYRQKIRYKAKVKNTAALISYALQNGLCEE